MEEIVKKPPEVQKAPVEKTRAESEPKKKGHGCLIAFLIFLAITIGLIVFIYLRIKQFLSNAGKEENLGITYSQQDYDNLQEKLGIADVPEESVCVGCPAPVYSQPKELNVIITSQEASAAFDIVNKKMPVGSIQNTQIKFGNGIAEISTLLSYEGRTFPVYLSGTLAKETPTTVTGDVSTLKVGNIKLPENVNIMVKEAVLSIFNESLASLGDNLRIDKLQITNEGLKFDGIAPTKIN